MANETNYSFDEVVVYKETTGNQIPANPKALKIAGVINFSLKEVQKTETNPTLSAGGQASKKDRGSSDFTGNIECKTMGDVMPFILTHVFGEPTKTNATTSLWAATTVSAVFNPYTLVGDIVNHSDGIHTLVCKSVAGTGITGAVEPDMTGLVSGDTIIDNPGANQVVWTVRGLLYKYEGVSDPCLGTFGGEYSATSGCDGGAEVFIKRFQGNFLNGYEISKSNGTIIHKYALPVVAMSSSDNVVGNPDGTPFVSIKSGPGYSEKSMNELPFGYDDLQVQIGGAEPVDGRNFRMAIARNISIEDATAQNTKTSLIVQMTVDGEIQLKFTKEQYLSAYQNENAVVKALFGKKNGDLAHFTFNDVEKDRVDPDFSTNEPAYLTIPLTASGDKANPTINFVAYSEVDY